MFIGHYGPAGAAGGSVRLWHAFLAVQFLDLLWAPLVLTGVEHVRIVPGFTAANHLDLYDMPVSHSLPMALVWSVIAGSAYAALNRRAGRTGAALIGTLVFSHWVLDFVAHTPDLLIWFGGEKVGLGLWNNRPLAFAVELSLYAGGLALFLTRTRPKGRAAAWALIVAVMVGVLMQVIGNWGPPPADANQAAWSALLAYAIFALLAAWLDATRRPAR